jgi:methionyl-tRNA synthetase
VLETETLVKPTCSLCGTAPIFKETKHLYIAISKLEKELKALVNQSHWRKNAVAFTNRYLEEGVRDRALTRDLDWGIEVPYPGYEQKKIYIWAENVLGYLSISNQVANKRGVAFEELWGENTRHYYVHAKDNIPFHTIILPALLLAQGEKYRLPDDIISNEYLTLEGRKISTSQNWAIWVKDIVDNYQPDSIRYFLIANGPEKRDTDFTWNEFKKCHNGELLGAYGNFINRVLVFVHKYFDGIVPNGQIDQDLETRLTACYQSVGNKIEQGKFKDGLEEIFELIRGANKYFDTRTPWITRTTDTKDCETTLYHCIVQLVNFAVLLEPFLPFSSERVIVGFGIDKNWAYKHISAGTKIPDLGILFQRLERED